MSPAVPEPKASPQANRQFALEVVERLRAAGFETLWAGGCVRDQLLGREPKDYDVATNARPEQVRAVFGKPRTLAIGAAFGVIAVLGVRGVQPIEVATFRRDQEYSDGRHPDGVIFSNAAEDAQRRDFTINGIFFDPIAKRVVDYVGGQEDLAARIVRAIGDPRRRFDEDKLRMARAIRFAATFDFALDGATFAAIRELAGEIVIVSAERVATEMRNMLRHARRRRAVELLIESNLLPILLPESANLASGASEFEPARQQMLTMLDLLPVDHFPAALAVLLRAIRATGVAVQARDVARRWRLTNHETTMLARLLELEPTIRAARATPWPRLQRILAAPGVDELLAYARAAALCEEGHAREIEFCLAKLALPVHQFDPPPLLTGDDLRAAGFLPGPKFRLVLDAVRDEQLEGRVATLADALQWAREFLESPGPSSSPDASRGDGPPPA